MAETPLTKTVRTLADERIAHLSDSAQKALSLARSLKSATPKEYSLPSSQSLDSFRGIHLDWTFEEALSIPTQLNRLSK